MGRGGERFVAELVSQRALDTPAAVPLRISDNKDGTYSASITPQRVGTYELALRSAAPSLPQGNFKPLISSSRQGSLPFFHLSDYHAFKAHHSHHAHHEVFCDALILKHFVTH